MTELEGSDDNGDEGEIGRGWRGGLRRGGLLRKESDLRNLRFYRQCHCCLFRSSYWIM